MYVCVRVCDYVCACLRLCLCPCMGFASRWEVDEFCLCALECVRPNQVSHALNSPANRLKKVSARSGV